MVKKIGKKSWLKKLVKKLVKKIGVFKISSDNVIFTVCLQVAYHGSLHDIFYIILLLYKSQKNTDYKFLEAIRLSLVSVKVQKVGEINSQIFGFRRFLLGVRVNLILKKVLQ